MLNVALSWASSLVNIDFSETSLLEYDSIHISVATRTNEMLRVELLCFSTRPSRKPTRHPPALRESTMFQLVHLNVAHSAAFTYLEEEPWLDRSDANKDLETQRESNAD